MINRIGSAFYGPVLAIFTLGILVRTVAGHAALFGFVAGLAANFALARFAPTVSWLWWNPAGFLVTCAVSLAVARVAPRLVIAHWPRRDATVLVAAFILMLALLLAGTTVGLG